MFICFTGTDGSGKSTLAQALVSRLNEDGKKSRYIYSRFRPRLIRPAVALGHAVFLRDRDVHRDYSEYSGTRKALFRNRFLAWAYERALLLDYCLQVTAQLRFPLMRGSNIVCDRYLYDTVITDLAADMGYSTERISGTLRSCFRMVPKPDIVFLIDTPEEIAFRRKNDVPSIDYLRDRRKIYLDVGRAQKMVILDGTRSLESLFDDIWSRVAG